MSDGNSSSGHGITFLGALQVLFIGLKLTGYIDWPWYAVLMPVIVEIVFIVVAILIIILGAVFGE